MHAKSPPSTTAMLIAACIASSDAAGEATAHVPQTSIALARTALREGGPAWRMIASAVRFGFFRALCRAFERIALPGIQCHFIARKQRLRDWCGDAVEQGFE